MPFSHPPEAPFTLLVEALESRIAPTNLTGLANNLALASDPRYLSYDTAPVPGQKLGFTPVGGDVFAIQLSGNGVQNPDGSFPNGDRIQIFSNAVGFSTFLQATDGSALAFFRDFNGDRQVQPNEFVGLSLGTGGGAIVNGSVNGDVVANLAPDGFTLLNTSAQPAQGTIGRLSVAGDINGSVLAPGGMANVNVVGKAGALLTGTAASGFNYHFNGDPGGPATSTLFVAAPADGQAGPGITNSSAGALDLARSGAGGFGASGGVINNFVVNADTDGFTLQSGAGGTGGGGVKAGNGGLLSNVTVGLRGNINDPTAHNPLTILGGNGGNGGDSKAGNGGALDSIAVGFVLDGNGNRQPSAFLLADNVTLQTGQGGDGFKGGNGGALTNSLVLVGTPDNPAGSADPAVVKLFSGDGGAQVSGGLGGKGGKGGAINTVDVRDLNTDLTRTTFTGLPASATATNAELLIQAGDGGLVLDGGRGKFGGSVANVTLLGYRLDVTAGDGALGNGAGGAGGSLLNVNVLARPDLLTTELILDAGQGGRGDNGSGGAGGSIQTVRVANSALTTLLINEGAHANGGESQGSSGGLGGAGGAVADVLVNGSRLFFTANNRLVAPGNAVLRAGDGGLGPNAGGNGGAVDGVQVIGSNFRLALTSGSGGGAFGDGSGGVGGAVSNVGVSNQPVPVASALLTAAPDVSVSVASGSGGAGAGAGVGGAGGAVLNVALTATQNISVTAGDGGAALLGAVGAGGNVTTSTAQAFFGSVTVRAGNAGAFGGAAGNGGAIAGFVADAGSQIILARGPGFVGDPRTDVTRGNLSLTAGDGRAGGAGGSVLNSGSPTLTPGSLLVTAGAGSGQGASAGAGGNIDAFTGFVGEFGPTRFTAGAGGSGNGAGGAGGSINLVTLIGGNDPNRLLAPAGVAPVPVVLSFDAGAGGNSGRSGAGGSGGGISNVIVSNLAANTVLHHLAAGDGGAGGGGGAGGSGGSLRGIHVGLPGERADIGIRSGLAYGYNPAQDPVTGRFSTAGGLFAGAAGRGGGASGDVTDVTAAAIASIAAGKGAAPTLAGTVDRIFLEGLNPTQANGLGDFTNFDRANLVGSVVNPAPGGGGSTFKFINVVGDGNFQPGDVPLDGLIAAVNLTQNRNFIPEALMSVDPASGNVLFVDPRQPGSAPGVNG